MTDEHATRPLSSRLGALTGRPGGRSGRAARDGDSFICEIDADGTLVYDASGTNAGNYEIDRR